MPGPGYWARIEAGQNPSRVPLPVEYSVERKVKKLPTSAEEVKKFNPPRTDYTISKMHALASATKAAIKEKMHEDTYSRVSVGGDGVLSCYIGKKSFVRATWLWNELVKRIESSGLSIDTKGGTKVSDGIQSVSLLLKEKSAKIKAQPKETGSKYGRPLLSLGNWEPTEWVTTGFMSFLSDLVFESSATHEWRDTTTGPLEDKLDSIVEGLKLLLIAADERATKVEQARREYDERVRIQSEVSEKKKIEKARTQRLKKLSENFRASTEIRHLINSLVETGNEALESEHSQNWVNWAMLTADELDPTRAMTEDLESNRDPTTPTEEDFEPRESPYGRFR